MRLRKGFTLVELLVVIGIIALLISILLPSLNNARRAGNNVKCLSNLRQITGALILYMNDSKGLLPPTNNGGSFYNRTWLPALVTNKYMNAPHFVWNGTAGYVNEPNFNTAFICPEGSKDFSTLAYSTAPASQLADGGCVVMDGSPLTGTPPTWKAYACNYAVNGMQYSDSRGASVGWGRLMTETFSDWFPFIIQPNSGSEAAHPKPKSSNMFSVKQSSKLGLLFDGAYALSLTEARMTFRHGSKSTQSIANRFVNFAFLDGHCESIDASGVPTAADGTANYYNKTKLNTDNNGKWRVHFITHPIP